MAFLVIKCYTKSGKLRKKEFSDVRYIGVAIATIIREEKEIVVKAWMKDGKYSYPISLPLSDKEKGSM